MLAVFAEEAAENAEDAAAADEAVAVNVVDSGADDIVAAVLAFCTGVIFVSSR